MADIDIDDVLGFDPSEINDEELARMEKELGGGGSDVTEDLKGLKVSIE